MLNNIDIAINNHFSKIHILVSKQRILNMAQNTGKRFLYGYSRAWGNVPRYTNFKLIVYEVDFSSGHTGEERLG